MYCRQQLHTLAGPTTGFQGQAVSRVFSTAYGRIGASNFKGSLSSLKHGQQPMLMRVEP